MPYYLSQEDRDVMQDTRDRVVRRRAPHSIYRRRRTKNTPPGKTGSVDITYVHIDEDINGVVDDDDALLYGYNLENPPGTEVDYLNLWAFEPVELDLKYYREADYGDPGYEEGKTKWILVTEEEYGAIIYATKKIIYLDGDPFEVGEYKRKDYTDYPENEAFPPDGTGTYSAPPAGFLNKRYRGVAINNILITAFCEALPPPPFTVGT
jgi:hypothetical protein